MAKPWNKISRMGRRRHMILLEVLISFALIVLCILPLLYPHVYMLRVQKQFVQTVELDHLVNLMYVEVLEKLYTNEISWNDIEGKRVFPIDSALLQKIGQTSEKSRFPFTGTYQFKEIRHKENEGLYASLLSLTFTFTPPVPFSPLPSQKQPPKSLKYAYQVFIARDL